MGGGKKSKAPSAPNYEALAKQQAADNYRIAQDVTAWNRPNQIDQYGNTLSWTKVPGQDTAEITSLRNQLAELAKTYTKYRGPQDDANARKRQQLQAQLDKAIEGNTQWQQKVSLGGTSANSIRRDAENKGSAQIALGKALAQLRSQTPFTRSDMPTYDEKNGKAVSDAVYASVMDRERPQQQRDLASLGTQLRQQGLQPGAEAYDRAMRNLMTSQGDVSAQAANQATIAGYDEARQRYLAQLQGNSQDFGQSLAVYNQPYQNAAALSALAGNPINPSFPGFSGATGYQPADLLGAANAGYAAKMGGYNSSNAKKGSTLGSGLGFAGSFLGNK